MGKYITPAEQVEEKGRKVELGETLASTRQQLKPGEELSAVAQRSHGKVALLVDGEGDFRAVKITKQGFLGLYAVSPELAATAS